MRCTKCGSENIKIEVVSKTSKTNHPSVLRRLGRLFLIIFTFGIWALIPKRKEKTTYTTEKVCVCQDCGESWTIK